MPDLTFKNIPQWVLDAYKQALEKNRADVMAKHPELPTQPPVTDRDVKQQMRGNIVGPARGFVHQQKQEAAQAAMLTAVRKEMDAFTDQEE